MSAIPQRGPGESQRGSPADPDERIAAPAPQPENPLQLLRDAIDLLKSSDGDFPDQSQVADLLAEARVALERANAVARAVTQSERFLKEARFDRAAEALDAGLLFYPGEPVLLARRREVEEQHKAFHAAAAARMAIEEAQWLLDQDRIDLAVHLLKDKAAELPGQPALISRLEELSALLPQWEQNRNVQTCLGRAAALEQLEQWQAALTVLEETLQSYPASQELIVAANRVRDQQVEHERRKKLARRLELIGQKIAAQSWKQALTLLEDTRKEFPGTPELNPLQREVEAGLSRSECEAVITEVRQCLADGELEHAEQLLSRGLESFGPDPTLEALRGELDSVRKYREELRSAQVLFGQRRLQEAESVLVQLVAPDRPEAKALLDAVREARKATEEENFCERGREKAQELMRQEQFAQAADLLRNLLSSHPGNPLLEKELMAAQSGLDQRSSEVDPAAGKANLVRQPIWPLTAPQPATQPALPAWANAATVRPGAPSRIRRAMIVGTGALVPVVGMFRNLFSLDDPGSPTHEKDLIAAQSGSDLPPWQAARPPLGALEASQLVPPPAVPAALADPAAVRASTLSRFRRPLIAGVGALVVVSATGAAWKLSRNGATASSPPVTFPAETPLRVAPSGVTGVATPPAVAQPKSSPAPPARQASATENTAFSKGKTQAPSKPLRMFIPVDTKKTPVESQDPSLPPPPVAAPIVSAQVTPTLPSAIIQPVTAPAPPPVAPPVAPPPRASAPVPNPKPAAPAVGGRFEEAQVLEHTMPAYPTLAREARAFGTVRMEALIDEHGVVKNVKVLSGHPILAAAARNAVLQWRYKAATLNGKPIATSVLIQISFGSGSNSTRY